MRAGKPNAVATAWSSRLSGRETKVKEKDYEPGARSDGTGSRIN